MDNSPTKNMLDQGHNFAFIGLVIALIAFSLPMTSIIVMNSSTSNIEILDSENIDDEEDIKSDEVEKTKEKENPPNILRTTVLLLSLGAILNGFLGMLRDKQRYMGGVAILIGVSAIISQYLWITLITIAVVIVVAVILVSLGVEF